MRVVPDGIKTKKPMEYVGIVSAQKGAKKFGLQVAAMVTSGIIVFYLTRKGVLSDLIFGNFRNVEFVEYALVFLSLTLTLAAVVWTYVIRTSRYGEIQDNSDQQDNGHNFHSAEVMTDLGEVEEQDVLVTGCVKYDGVHYTADLLSDGEIEIENVRCPECNARLLDKQDIPEEIEKEIELRKQKEEERSLPEEPRRAMVCPNPNCEFYKITDRSYNTGYAMESIFDRHFRKIKNQSNFSIQRLKTRYRERTGRDDEPGPSELWHEYYRLTDAEEVCSEIETGSDG